MSENSNEQKPEWIEDWKEMKKFGDWLFQHGISCSSRRGLDHTNEIFEQRVALVLVHQAAEILLKSYLIRELGAKIIIDSRQNNNHRDKTIAFMKAVDKAQNELDKKGIQINKESFEKFKNRHKEKENNRKKKYFFVPVEEIKKNNSDLSFSKYREMEYEEVKYEKPEVLKKKILELENKIIDTLKDIKVS